MNPLSSKPSSQGVSKSNPSEQTPITPSDTDSILSASTTDIHTYLTYGNTHVPALNSPNSSDQSIAGAYRALLDAVRGYKESLHASKLADIDSRKFFSLSAVEQSKELDRITQERTDALAKMNDEINRELNELKDDYQAMQEAAEDIQAFMDELNKGNLEEQKQCQALVEASAFGEDSDIYKEAYETFNTYWEGRSKEISQYNDAAAQYNNQAAEYNHHINDLYSKYQLSPAPPIPIFDSVEDNISLDADIFKLAEGVPELSLTSASSPDIETLYESMYETKYPEEIAIYDQIIKQLSDINIYLSNKSKIQSLDKEISHENLLHSKHLTNKLLAPHPSEPLTVEEMIAEEIAEEKAAEGLLGGKLTKKALSIALKETHPRSPAAPSQLESFNLETAVQDAKAMQDFDSASSTAVSRLNQKLLLLNGNMLGNQSLQSLFPSLGIIADALPSLPKDSPAYAILFSTSLVNRVCEDLTHGITDETIEAFLNAYPEFAALPPQAKKEIKASLAIGQLLTAGKLLEESLGMPGLLASLLPHIPGLDIKQMTDEAKEEEGNELINLEDKVAQQFIDKGYPEEKAHFFASLSAKLTSKGLMTPNLTSNLSRKTIDIPLLKESIQAKLALSEDIPLEQAKTIANEAVDNTFDETPQLTPKKFRNQLTSHLADLGIKNGEEMVKGAIFLPADPPSPLIGQKNSDNSSTIILETAVQGDKVMQDFELESLTIGGEHSQKVKAPPIVSDYGSKDCVNLSPSTAVSRIIQTKVKELLAPQLGGLLAQEVGDSVVRSLFGMPNEMTPYSFRNVLQEQVLGLTKENDKAWNDKLHETFKDSIKTMVSFPEFSKKLLDPAYRYVLASGIIYGNQGKKNGIDIPI